MTDDDEKTKKLEREEAIMKLKIAERWGQLGDIAEEIAEELPQTLKKVNHLLKKATEALETINKKEKKVI